MTKVEFIQHVVALFALKDMPVEEVIARAEQRWEALARKGYGTYAPQAPLKPAGDPQPNPIGVEHVSKILPNSMAKTVLGDHPAHVLAKVGTPPKSRQCLLSEKRQWERLLEQNPDKPELQWLLNDTCRLLGLPQPYPNFDEDADHEMSAHQPFHVPSGVGDGAMDRAGPVADAPTEESP